MESEWIRISDRADFETERNSFGPGRFGDSSEIIFGRTEHSDASETIVERVFPTRRCFGTEKIRFEKRMQS